MKEIIVAAAAGLLMSALATAIFRTWLIERRASMLLRIYLACFCVLVAIYMLTPDDLYFLPHDTIVPSRPVGLLFCGFLYTAGFFGGVLQIYNLADRGLSLRMLIDISVSKAGAMTAAEMTTAYADGKGLVWMYDKRLDGIVATGLARRDRDSIVITTKGTRFARLFARLKALAQIRGETS
jgi:uncharacterized membrane protein YfcA